MCVLGEDRARELISALDGRIAGVGPAVPLADAARSFRLACAALALAEERGLEAPLAVDAHRFDLLSRAEPALSPRSPPTASRPWPAETVNSRARLEATLLAWLRHAGNVAAAARELGVHPQTVRYRLGRLRELSAPRSRTPTRASSSSWCCGRDDRRRHLGRRGRASRRARPGLEACSRIQGAVVRRAIRVGERSRSPRRRGAATRCTCAPTPTRRRRLASALARLRFVLSLDDDLEPFHRAHRSHPLLGRIVKARPKLRVLRKPEPFEALAWAIIEQLIDTQRAGDIAWSLTRRHGDQHTAGPMVRPPPTRWPTPRGSKRPAFRPRSRARWPAWRSPSRADSSTRLGRPAPARRDPRRRRVDARAPGPLRARDLRRAAAPRRRHAQRLRPGHRGAHRKRR